MPAVRQAILFRAHRYSAGSARTLARLVREAGDGYDVWLVGCCLEPAALDGFGHPRTRAYDVATLSRLPYPAKLNEVDWTRIVGHNDLPVLQFCHDHPEYARYWNVEYDVRYTSDWGGLFADLSRSSAALLGTTVQTHADNPAWANWGSLHTGGETVDRSRWLKSFLPFAALTREAFIAIDSRYRQGWTGHCEATWPTILGLAGLAVEDIGGVGRFVPPGRARRYYWNTPLDPHLRPGSFVFRPTAADDGDDQAWTGRDAAARGWAAGQLGIAGRLVHPVKD